MSSVWWGEENVPIFYLVEDINATPDMWVCFLFFSSFFPILTRIKKKERRSISLEVRPRTSTPAACATIMSVVGIRGKGKLAPMAWPRGS